MTLFNIIYILSLNQNCLCVEGSAGCVQTRERNRPQAGVCRPLHHRTAVGRRHQRTVGPTGHQHPVSETPNWAAPQNSFQVLTFLFVLCTSSFPNNYWDKFVKRKVRHLHVFFFHPSFFSAVASRLVIFTKCQPQRRRPAAVSDLPPLCRWSKSTATCTAPRG